MGAQRIKLMRNKKQLEVCFQPSSGRLHLHCLQLDDAPDLPCTKRSHCLLQLRNIRREVAELLRNNKQGNARIRVESVLLINKMLHAYDIIELFLELLAVSWDPPATGQFRCKAI